MSRTIPPQDWVWFGHAAHYCMSHACRFHLATKIGPYVVSSVGDLRTQPDECRSVPEEIGSGRTFETMVFKVTGDCACGCGLPLHNGEALWSAGYGSAMEATAGHYAACQKAATGAIAEVALDSPWPHFYRSEKEYADEVRHGELSKSLRATFSEYGRIGLTLDQLERIDAIVKEGKR